MFPRVVNVTQKLDFSDSSTLLESNPIVAEAGGLQSQGAKGAAVVKTTASRWQRRIWSPPDFCASPKLKAFLSIARYSSAHG